ncbi:MAG TPA: O-antigen ligase family protein [Armatimonadota bacterium]|nr:O-antigen ligase family protein [Armatimonadota bacterium]
MVSALAVRPGLHQSHPDMAFRRRLLHTKTAFYLLCGYLIVQAFQIPLLAIGPSWALWPTLSDVFAGLLILAYLADQQHFKVISGANLQILRSLTLITCATLAVLIATYTVRFVANEVGNSRAGTFGVFQIYRLIQFTLIFRVAAGIPMTPKRLAKLSKAAGAALIAVLIGLAGTYSSLIRTSWLVALLPSDFNTAGPWAYMAHTQLYDVGTIGYNHAYTAIQIMMLLSLYMALRAKENRTMVVVLLLLSLGGVFLTGSRAGMAAMVLFVAAYFIRKPGMLAIAVVLTVFLLVGAGSLIDKLDINVSQTLHREAALSNPLDPGNLSGRQGIWLLSLAFLKVDPLRWAIGAGPGSAAQLGTNAHMLFLHIILESGLIGLSIFGWVAYNVLRRLRRQGAVARPIFWVTVAFLISSLTQETFYPLPSFGHFLGLYLCSLAIILNTGDRRQPRAGNHRNPVLQLRANVH